MRSVLSWCIIFVIERAKTELFSAEELDLLPQLYDLDHYERCLSRHDGIYCLGTFELTPKVEPHPVYDLMKEKTNILYTFNRTLIHRGYCVSERCKTLYHDNVTYRFEQCASLQANDDGFNARLQTGQCITHEQRKLEADRPLDIYEKIFLYAISLIVIINVVGTAYDLKSGDVNKNIFLMSWSIRVNWRKLFDTTCENWGIAVNGLKVIITIVVVYIHNVIITNTMYSYSPEELENSSKTWLAIFLRNSNAGVQCFILLSCFLTANNLLKASTRSPVTTTLVLKMILKKVLRILPVMMLVTGFVATWWPHIGDGPQWASTVRKESQLCRKNFWFYTFFLNNLLHVKQQCLLQGWGMAADIQYTILSLFLTVFFLKTKVTAITGLRILYAFSFALNVFLAYIHEWDPIGKLAAPEIMRTRFETVREMSQLHMSPWGNLSGCISGLLCAHIVFERHKSMKKDEGDNKTEEVKNKNILINFVNNYKIIILIILNVILSLNKFIFTVENRLIIATFVGLERLLMTSILIVLFIHLYYSDGYARKFLSWRGWTPFSRLSFSMNMVHWSINLAIAARRPRHLTTLISIAQDWIVTVVISYIMALPVSLMLEYPIVNLSNLMFMTSSR